MSRPLVDDKRLIQDNEYVWVERKSLRGRRYCRYCRRRTPQFRLKETRYGELSSSTIHCCWECGSGAMVGTGVAIGV